MADNITKQSKCNRYGKDLQRGQIMSRLNTQIICLDCADRERERTALRHGESSGTECRSAGQLLFPWSWTVDEDYPLQYVRD